MSLKFSQPYSKPCLLIFEIYGSHIICTADHVTEYRPLHYYELSCPSLGLLSLLSNVLLFCMLWMQIVIVTVGCCFVTTKQNSHKYSISTNIKNTFYFFTFWIMCITLVLYLMNIYNDAFCKWTNIAYMLVRMSSSLDFVV